jgi:plasmid stabilization system protein ParE
VRVVLRRAAERDMAEAARWYEQQRVGLGDEFMDAVKQAQERIRAYPQAYPHVRVRIRRIVVAGFPYGVFYFDEPDRVVITGCFHLRQSPRRWTSRS